MQSSTTAHYSSQSTILLVQRFLNFNTYLDNPMTGKNGWFVYLLRCGDNSLYTGVTTDLERRLHEHNHTPRGAKYTRARRPVTLAYSEPAHSRQAACRREWEIKQLRADEKEQLIATPADNLG
jgi:putative endonuclease